jgi:small subunit ribosomal protein S1
MIHISELADGQVVKTEDAVKEGDEVEFVVLATDADERRFSLSRKAALKGLAGEELKQYIGAASGSKTAFAEAFTRAQGTNS